ncbi:MAG: carbonic anhydrase family protein, partial [Rhodothermales bacterium]
MKPARTIPILAILTLVGCSKMSIRSATPQEAGHPEWTYAGEHGPQHWAEDYPECGMPGQSPVDITDDEPADLPPLNFTYDGVNGRVRDTGHAIQVDSDGGNMRIGAVVHILQQLHFHAPSEHTVDGERFDAVMHLVHLDPDSQIVVVGIPIAAGDENSFVEDVLDAMEQPDTLRQEVEP